MVSFLAVTQVLFVVGLVATVLMHSGRDAGMGGMGFTPTSQGGTHIVERNLTRVTLVFAILFVANSGRVVSLPEVAGARLPATMRALSRWWRNW